MLIHILATWVLMIFVMWLSTLGYEFENHTHRFTAAFVFSTILILLLVLMSFILIGTLTTYHFAYIMITSVLI